MFSQILCKSVIPLAVLRLVKFFTSSLTYRYKFG